MTGRPLIDFDKEVKNRIQEWMKEYRCLLCFSIDDQNTYMVVIDLITGKETDEIAICKAGSTKERFMIEIRNYLKYTYRK